MIGQGETPLVGPATEARGFHGERQVAAGFMHFRGCSLNANLSAEKLADNIAVLGLAVVIKG